MLTCIFFNEKRKTIKRNEKATKQQRYETEISNIELGNYYNLNTENQSTI